MLSTGTGMQNVCTVAVAALVCQHELHKYQLRAHLHYETKSSRYKVGLGGDLVYECLDC